MTGAVWKLLFGLFLGVLQVVDTSLLIRKCCNERDYLNTTDRYSISCIRDDGHEYSLKDTFRVRKGVSEVRTAEHPEFPWWMDPKVIPLSATSLAPVSRFLSDQGSESYIEYGVGVNNTYFGITLVRSTDSGYSLLNNGSLMFQTNNGNNISFPPRSYCADMVSFESGETSFEYVVFPCKYTECIGECCTRDRVMELWWGFTMCRRRDVPDIINSLNSNIIRGFNFSYLRCSYAEHDHVFYRKDNILWNFFKDSYVLSLSNNIKFNETVNNFCVDILRSKRPENYEYQLVTCEFETIEPYQFFFVVNYINAAVLVLTLLVFALSGEINNSKSRIIVIHIMCVLVAEVCSGLIRHEDYYFGLNLKEVYLHYFSTAAPLWINVLCFDLAASFRSFWVSNSNRRSNNNRRFLYYSIYVWGVTTVAWIFIYFFTNDDLEAEYIYRFYISFTCGMVNFLLLSYSIIQLIRLQRQGRGLDKENSARHNAASCFSKYRRLLVHINLLLLMGPPAACESIIYRLVGPFSEVRLIHDCMKLLRALSILLFVLLKRRIWILLSNKMKTFSNLFTRKEGPITSGPRTATTAL